MVAAVSGLVLLISLFLNWYKVSASGGLIDVSASVSGWEALGFIDILLFLIAVIAIAVAILRATSMMPRGLPITPGLLILGLGVLALLLVIFRLLSIPDEGAGDIPGVDVGRSFGIFIALIAAAGVTAGGWLGWNEEGRPSPGSAGAGAGPGPLGAGGQPGGYGQQPQQQQYAQPPAGAAAPAAEQATAQQPAPQQAAAQPQGSWPPPAGGAADWYPDPSGQKRLRYWDGNQWTDHVAD